MNDTLYGHERSGHLVFEQVGEFEAFHAAEAWCAANGISVGRMQAGSPCGLMRGDFDIAKWRNLNVIERQALHGEMTGDFRNGPVFVKMEVLV